MYKKRSSAEGDKVYKLSRPTRLEEIRQKKRIWFWNDETIAPEN